MIGLDAIVYSSATSIGSSPTWSAVPIVEEVTLNLEHAEAETKNRGSDWVKILLGLKNASVDLTLTYKPADSGYQAIRDAFLNKTDLALALMDGDIATTGSEGLQADFKVTKFTRNEPLEENLTVTATVRPSAESTAEPAWTEVA